MGDGVVTVTLMGDAAYKVCQAETMGLADDLVTRAGWFQVVDTKIKGRHGRRF